MPAALTWDIFCKVIDNHGDIGVCWRLARDLATRGQRVRLWVDHAEALQWMAPGGHAGVELRHWAADDAGSRASASAQPHDVVIEAFGCELDASFIERMAERAAVGHACRWINLEYLSAEAWVERCHGLRSPVMSGPGRGLEKFFFYPGFTAPTGGLLREPDLPARQAAFDRSDWLRARAVDWQPGEALVSLFCYEPALLAALLAQLAQQHAHLLVTPGRAARAVQAALAAGAAAPRITWLPALPQPAFDELLWACDLNFVRGEDSFVRALWAGKPFVWQIYPQNDDAHHAKLEAFLDWSGAPDSLRRFSRAWNGMASELPPIEPDAWAPAAHEVRRRALAQADLTTQLLDFAARADQRHP